MNAARVSAPHIAILGSVGVPATYGGFETLAEQLALYHERTNRAEQLSIFCSKRAYTKHPRHFRRAHLHYLPFPANGAGSLLYDTLSLLRAKALGVDMVLLLGVSGAIILPAISGRGMRIVTHIDGQEWNRAKWPASARAALRLLEKLAVHHSDAIIADNPAIADDIARRYGIRPILLPYGGDQGITLRQEILPVSLSEKFALSLCRIEPENNVEMILRAAASGPVPLVFVGTWDRGRYGRNLRRRYGTHPNLHLIDPIYDHAALTALRQKASLYIHGHSAGGTNPSLVEMMHHSCPVLAYDCIFNRQTLAGHAKFFRTSTELREGLFNPPSQTVVADMRRVAQACFKWDTIGARYFTLFNQVAAQSHDQRTIIRGRKCDPETTRDVSCAASILDHDPASEAETLWQRETLQ